MRVEAYKTALFNGTGIVPEIAQLQQWIETAWQAGFDVEVPLHCVAALFVRIVSIVRESSLCLFFYRIGCSSAGGKTGGYQQVDRHYRY